jgi:hypothetical protein
MQRYAKGLGVKVDIYIAGSGFFWSFGVLLLLLILLAAFDFC